MPEPDSRKTRLEALRLQLEPLALKALKQMENSPERDALDDRLMEVVWAVAALGEELRG